MDIKTKWNNLKTWKKGALIGFALSILLATIFAVVSYFNFLQNPTIEVGCVFQEDCMVPFIFIFLIMLVCSIPAIVIGGMIGYFVNKKNGKG